MVFVDDPAAPVLTEGDRHHLLDVLRLRAGETVIAADGVGGWAPCRVGVSAGTTARRAAPESVLVPDGPLVRRPRPDPTLTVAFVPTKGDRPEWVVQKLTELGVDRIVPLRSHRSVVRWEGDRAARAVERLRRVVREAAGQCRQLWVPEVAAVTTLDGLSGLTGLTPVLAHPGGGPPSLDRPVVAVGPEGGWDDEEVAAFGAGVGLGPTVLRAETAAVALGAVLCALRSGVV
jgi:16S rRNA (uracil1498-N3)-methyltransferase